MQSLQCGECKDLKKELTEIKDFIRDRNYMKTIKKEVCKAVRTAHCNVCQFDPC